MRAYAVLVVVLYHFGVLGFSGGFVGVDIFFVISGFLMTKIIYSGLNKENFSLLQFYYSRAKRIIPTLIILCLTLLSIGWYLLPAMDYRALGIHSVSALVFLSNFKFWKESGYFDTSSHENLLLHTWSLSVEWQFYIVLPLIFILVWFSLGKKWIVPTLALIALISLTLLCVSWYTDIQSTGAFYLLPTRAWEMTAGGLTWLLTRNIIINKNKIITIEYSGIGLIAFSVLYFNSSYTWPGPYALIPVIGTVLVLTANNNNSIFTGNILAQKIGLNSYSTYLWHWPLVVLLNYAGKTNELMFVTLCIILSFSLGELSFRLIESPSQRLLNRKYHKPTIYIFSIILISIIGFSYFIYTTNGANFSWRHGANSAVSKYLDIYNNNNSFVEEIKKEYKEECNFFDSKTNSYKTTIASNCVNTDSTGGVFLWGDSHAQAISYGLRHMLKETIPFSQVATSSCQPRIKLDTSTTGEYKVACDRSNQYAFSHIMLTRPSVVIMVQHAGHELNEYDDTINRLKKLNIKNIIILGPIPQWEPSLPKAIGFRHFNPNEKRIIDSSFDTSLLKTDKLMKSKYGKIENVYYLSLIDALCNRDGCIAKVDDQNTPLVWDYGHLTLQGSVFIAENILSQIDALKVLFKK